MGSRAVIHLSSSVVVELTDGDLKRIGTEEERV